MTLFEREKSYATEAHPSIELSDLQHLEKLLGTVIKAVPKLDELEKNQEAELVYRAPFKIDDNSPEILKQDMALAEKLCKETKVIDLRSSDATVKSKKTTKKSKKIHSKSNTTAVA